MAVPVLKYPLDLTGSASTNLITGEVHDLSALAGRPNRAFVLNYGPFYNESVTIARVDTGAALTTSQYVLTELVVNMTQETGLAICSVIIITDSTLPNDLSVSVSAQMLGGEYSYSMEAMQQMVNSLDLDNRQVYWNDILDKPAFWQPAPHYHAVGDIYGFEYVCAALERVRQAIFIGQEGSLKAIYQYVDHADGILQDNIDEVQAKLTAESERAESVEATLVSGTAGANTTNGDKQGLSLYMGSDGFPRFAYNGGTIILARSGDTANYMLNDYKLGTNDLASIGMHVTPAAHSGTTYNGTAFDTPQFGWNASSTYVSVGVATVPMLNAAIVQAATSAAGLYLPLTGGTVTGSVQIQGGATIGTGLTVNGGATIAGNLTTNGKIYGSGNAVGINYGPTNTYHIGFQNDGNLVLSNGTGTFGTWKDTGFSTSAPATLSGGLTLTGNLGTGGQTLKVLYGPSGAYSVAYQTDGNFVLSNGNTVFGTWTDTRFSTTAPATLSGGLTVTGSVNVPDNSLSISDTNGLQAALNSKALASDLAAEITRAKGVEATLMSGTIGMASTDLQAVGMHYSPTTNTPQFAWNDSTGKYQSVGLVTKDFANSMYLPLSGGTVTGALTVNGGATIKSGLNVTGDAAITGSLTTNGKIYGSANAVGINYGANNTYHIGFQNDGNLVLSNASGNFGSWKDTGFSTSAPATLSGGLTVSGGLTLTGNLSTGGQTLKVLYGPSGAYSVAYQTDGNLVLSNGNAVFGTWTDTRFSTSAPATLSGGLTVTGSVNIPDASLTISDTNGLQAALNAKALATDLTAEVTRAKGVEATLMSGTAGMASTDLQAVGMHYSPGSATPQFAWNDSSGKYQSIGLVTKDFASSTYLPLSGGTVTGSVQIQGGATIGTGLTVNGGATITGTLTVGASIYGSKNVINVMYGPSNGYKAAFQNDGNFVWYNGSTAFATFRDDGSSISSNLKLGGTVTASGTLIASGGINAGGSTIYTGTSVNRFESGGNISYYSGSTLVGYWDMTNNVLRVSTTAIVANLTVAGTVNLPNNSLTISDTSGLQSALDAKALGADLTAEVTRAKGVEATLMSGTVGMASTDLQAVGMHYSPGSSTPQFAWNDSSGKYQSVGLVTKNFAASTYLPLAGGTLTGALTVSAGATITGTLSVGSSIVGPSNAVGISYGPSNGYHIGFQNDGNLVLSNGSTNFGAWKDTGLSTSAPASLNGGLTVKGSVTLPSKSVAIAAINGISYGTITNGYTFVVGNIRVAAFYVDIATAGNGTMAYPVTFSSTPILTQMYADSTGNSAWFNASTSTSIGNSQMNYYARSLASNGTFYNSNGRVWIIAIGEA